MTFFQKLERYERMLCLMKRRATGSPSEFAKRMDISESTLYDNLNDLKCRGADVQFSEAYQSYVLLNDFDIVFGCSNLELNKIKGGKTIFNTLRKTWSKSLYTCRAFN